MNKLFITIILVLCFAQFVAAQSMNPSKDKITWESEKTIVLPGNHEHIYASTVITDPASSKIILKTGNRVQEFAITEQTGSWENVDQDGQLVFSITFGEEKATGSISVERNGDDKFVLLDMSGSNLGVKKKIVINQIIR